MGDLPAARSTRSRPFLHSGLDYAGPFQVRTSKGRGQKSHKAYLALFVCLSTRAIHLELVSDYTSETFLAAFRRFVSRRGLPSDLYSDNGTTFVGGDKELRNAFRAVIQDPNVGNLLATDHVNWHFIPPGAPHFGGLWEAGVKCTKHHLRRVLGSRTLTFEELTTLIAQIEACLNSRPIGPLITDPSEFAVLTPGHFLIGAPLTSVPEPTVLDLNENRLTRWQLVRQTLELFWKRWSSEYLHTLQVRTKWRQPMKNVQIVDLVLVRNANLPPSKWLLGRITACHPGPDERVRVVTIKTATSELKRPITQICVLPIHSSDSPPTSDKSSSTDLSFQDCTDNKSESSDSQLLE